jgi:Arc/MetJ-type ribon-helix-helix transcriptional regulator
MSTITVPLSENLVDFINEQIKLGNAANKADLVRRAIQRMKEDEFVNSILKAKREIKEGKALTGDLDKLAKGFD